MQITFNRHTALAIIRALRTGRSASRVLMRRSEIVAPNPSPRTRWSKGLFSSVDLGLPLELEKLPLEVAVPEESLRLGTKGVANTTYAGTLPDGSFVDLGNGIAISGPELVFAELAGFLNPIQHLMLGHELCGTFSRDPLDPYNGPITYGVKPATTAEGIRSFLMKSRYIHGIGKAAASARYLNDNAWSPTESLVAALLRLPIDSLGYDIGELTLNPRESMVRPLPGSKASRVPDIIIAGTPVGVNYDGLAHLDLRSVVDAAFDVSAHPKLAHTQAALERSVRNVRAKALDDIRRNRELAADGLFVFPLVKEDLYTPGGLDLIVGHLLDSIERLAERDMSNQRKILQKKALSRERHRAILSLLPGKSERNIQIGRFIHGYKVSEDPGEVYECWIEF